MLAQRAAMYSAAVYGQLSSGMSALDEGTATKYIESLIEYVVSPFPTALIHLLISRCKDPGSHRGPHDASEEGALR